MSINKVFLSGNLTRDPELRSTSGGTSVLSFSMAVNERRKNAQTGEWEDYPNFVDCTMFGNRADAVSKFLSKGMRVAVEGRLSWSQWERDGQKRSKLAVIVDEIVFMQQHNGNQSSAPQQPAYSPQNPQLGQGYQPAQNYLQQPAYGAPRGFIQAPPIQGDGQPSLYDEDIPF